MPTGIDLCELRAVHGAIHSMRMDRAIHSTFLTLLFLLAKLIRTKKATRYKLRSPDEKLSFIYSCPTAIMLSRWFPYTARAREQCTNIMYPA
jgi:hypothetical protein